MAIVDTITDEYHFWHWLKNSDSYQNNFSIEGAKAVQDYFEQLSEDMGKDIEFDPIAWCVEFSEYDSVKEAYRELVGDDDSVAPGLEYFEDRTTVIELDNGHIIVGEF